MITKLLQKLKFKISPPKAGDVFYGDSYDFVIGSNVEKVLHGMQTRNGDPIWSIVPGKDTYRLTIESTTMPNYYRLTAECLSYRVHDDAKAWLKRSQPRRICKPKLMEMILNGTIKA